MYEVYPRLSGCFKMIINFNLVFLMIYVYNENILQYHIVC